MKTGKNRKHEGSVIVVALILTILVSLAIASSMRLTLTELRLSHHSAVWAKALHSAEAGVEVAMYEFYRDLVSSDGWAGWSNVTGNTYALNDVELPDFINGTEVSYYSVTADVSALTIDSLGRVEAPRLDSEITRSVEVTLDRDIFSPFSWGMLAKGWIEFKGSPPICDSYNSDLGPYGPGNMSTNCDVGSMDTNSDAIRSNTGIWILGDGATAEGGDVDNINFSGTVSHGLNVTFPPIVIPHGTNMTDPAITGTITIDVTGGTNMGVPYIDPHNGTVVFRGDGICRVYSDGVVDFGTSSDLSLVPTNGADLSLELYVNGASANIKGTLNVGGDPANFKLLGTENLKAIDCQANNDRMMTIYAPNAHVDIGGNAEIFGSICAGTIRVHGNPEFHYDESLTNELIFADEEYSIARWIEIIGN